MSSLSSWRLGRVAVALGGLAILLGIVLMGIFVLARLDMIDLNAFAAAESRTVLLWMVLAVGLLDLASGIMLGFRRR